jgi:hypothetical protein
LRIHFHFHHYRYHCCCCYYFHSQARLCIVRLGSPTYPLLITNTNNLAFSQHHLHHHQTSPPHTRRHDNCHELRKHVCCLLTPRTAFPFFVLQTCRLSPCCISTMDPATTAKTATATSSPSSSPGLFSPSNNPMRPHVSSMSDGTPHSSPYLHPLQMHKVRE